MSARDKLVTALADAWQNAHEPDDDDPVTFDPCDLTARECADWYEGRPHEFAADLAQALAAPGEAASLLGECIEGWRGLGDSTAEAALCALAPIVARDAAAWVADELHQRRKLTPEEEHDRGYHGMRARDFIEPKTYHWHNGGFDNE